MNKVLSAIGALTLSLVLVALLIACGTYCYFKLYLVPLAKTDFKKFSAENFKPILNNLSEEQIISNAPTDKHDLIVKGDFVKNLQEVSKLGHLLKMEDPHGSYSYSFQRPDLWSNLGQISTIAAELHTHSEFQNGNANISMQLISIHGSWKIVSLSIESPIFQKSPLIIFDVSQPPKPESPPSHAPH